jgi:hypothetical protein
MGLESEFAASSFAQLRTDDGLLFPNLIRQGLPTIQPECAGGFYVHRGFCDPLTAETQGLVRQGLIHRTKLAL